MNPFRYFNKFDSEEKNKIRSMLQQDDVDDYELENPREKVDYSYFGEKSYLENRNLPPIKVYIYGNYPHFEKATAYFMLKKAGVEFSPKYRDHYYDLGWFWDSRITVDKQAQKCREFSSKLKFINLYLVDTSKDYVAKTMEENFGYTFKIDPKTFDGYCIAKHNGNGTKSCFFLKCPINADEIFHDHCYQKIINFTSDTDKNILNEIRVPVFKNIIPFIFFKTRNKGLRFTSKNKSMNIVNPLQHLTAEECDKILSYCKNIGLEYGELDILRCENTKQIYIIDVNNTAWWPPNKLGDADRNIALNLMWNAFLEAFMPDKFERYHVPDNYLDDFVDWRENAKPREKKKMSYRGLKYVGNLVDRTYEEKWRELYAGFLSRPPSQPKPEKKQEKKPEKKQEVKQEKPNDKKKEKKEEKKMEIIEDKKDGNLSGFRAIKGGKGSLNFGNILRPNMAMRR